MKVARILITPELLREALHLPITTEIVMARLLFSPTRDAIELTVCDPDLRDVVLAEGEEPPTVTPSFRKHQPVEFLGWGQKT